MNKSVETGDASKVGNVTRKGSEDVIPTHGADDKVDEKLTL